MTEHELTATDVARMRTPLWEQAKTAIAQGHPGDAVALIDRAVEQWAALKDYSINWITSLLTFIGEELGEDAVEQALRKTGEEFVRPRRDTGTDWGSLPASARAKVIARAMLANMGAVDVEEDEEKIVLSFRCGSGGKLIDDGRYEGDHPYLRLRERAPRTFMRDELWGYSAHCSVNNEIQAVEWGGSPASIEHPPHTPGEPCVHHVYKDVSQIPDSAYERIGQTPRPSGEEPPMATDYAASYRDARATLTSVTGELDDAGLTRPVPATPGWDVRDVVAHVVGIASDLLEGNLSGVGGDEWTAAQVNARRGLPFAEVLAEWGERAPVLEEQVASWPPEFASQLVSDLALHDLDVRGALGRRDGRDAPAVQQAFDHYAHLFGERLDESGAGAVRVETPDATRVVGAGDPTVSVAASRFELLRALAGRRRREADPGLPVGGRPRPGRRDPRRVPDARQRPRRVAARAPRVVVAGVVETERRRCPRS